MNSAGDVNGDGYSDLAIGAWGYDAGANDNAGRVDLYHGSSKGITGSIAISLIGQISGEHFGYALGTAGDVDGDGYADLIVREWRRLCRHRRRRPRLWQRSGQGLRLPWLIRRAGRNAHLTATGKNTYSGFADDVATAGDLNGDGYADIVVKALFCYLKACWTYAHVYHGSDQGLETAPGWTITNLSFIPEIGSAGDVNGDGYGDLVVSNSFTTFFPATLGEVYVYHGSPGWPGRHAHLDSHR